MIRQQLEDVASGRKLICFESIFDDPETIDYAVNLADQLGLYYDELDIRHGHLQGKCLVFCDAENQKSFGAAQILIWIENSRADGSIPAEIHWILNGILAGFDIQDIKQFLRTQSKNINILNQEIQNYFPPSLSNLFII
jgi:hypothetical protein